MWANSTNLGAKSTSLGVALAFAFGIGAVHAQDGAVRPGPLGDANPASTAPPSRARLSRLPAPEFPERALMAGVSEGSVTLLCRALADGSLEQCTAREETPPGLGFGESALAAVRRQGFVVRNDKGEPFQVTFTIRFVSPSDDEDDAAPVTRALNGWPEPVSFDGGRFSLSEAGITATFPSGSFVCRREGALYGRLDRDATECLSPSLEPMRAIQVRLMVGWPHSGCDEDARPIRRQDGGAFKLGGRDAIGCVSRHHFTGTPVISVSAPAGMDGQDSYLVELISTPQTYRADREQLDQFVDSVVLAPPVP